jgi:hypothetical protein
VNARHLIFAAWIVIASSIGTRSARAEPTKAVAVFPIEDTSGKIDPQALKTIYDYLSARIGNLPGLSIIPSSEVHARIEAQQAESYRACYDEACQIEIGKEVAASKAVSTKIAEVGGGCLISSYMYDLARAATDATASARAACDPGSLITAMDEIAKRLKDALGGEALFGAIEIHAKPDGGDIAIDGASTGLRAPSVLKRVATGVHRIAVETDDARGEATLKVDASRTSSVVIELFARPSMLAISTYPDKARISINGKASGVSPLLVEVKPGDVVIGAETEDGHKGQASVLARPSRAPKDVSMMLVKVDGEKEEDKGGLKIGWLVTGGLLFGTGVVLDTVPSSAHDHHFDPIDLVPLGFYVLGTGATALGVLPALF